jgi:hypothetical protein
MICMAATSSTGYYHTGLFADNWVESMGSMVTTAITTVVFIITNQ